MCSVLVTETHIWLDYSDTIFQVPVVKLALKGANTLDVIRGLKSITDDVSIIIALVLLWSWFCFASDCFSWLLCFQTDVMVAGCVTVMDSGAALSIIGCK